jgi:hypothetical protein
MSQRELPVSESGAEYSGCPVCRVAPPSQRVRNLYEAPHEGYALLRCPACGQTFLEQFQEITWLPGGEDHIWQRWMPLTPEEAAEIERLCPTTNEELENTNRFPTAGEDQCAHHLALLMHRRGRLVRDPMGRLSWSEQAWDAGNLYPPG